MSAYRAKRKVIASVLMLTFIGCLCSFGVLAGCSRQAYFPSEPVSRGEDMVCWQVEGGRKDPNCCDYFQVLDESGRVVRMQYDTDGDCKPDATVELASAATQGPHYVILLDGVPFRLVEQMYRQGRFRLFYPPSKLISCFPSMTDLAFSQVFSDSAPLGYEALYYDRRRNRLSNGNAVYLQQLNAPWQKFIDYRTSMLMDAIGYLKPRWLFGEELAGIKRTFDRNSQDTVIGYSVATAGIATRYGMDALMRALRKVDRFCQRLMYDRSGRARITLMADHGHNFTPGTYFKIAQVLKDAGFHVTGRLKRENDVVVPEYGLVTCAAIYTRAPAEVAGALLQLEPVNLAVFADGEAITVKDRSGSARIEKGLGGYRYIVDRGDPLQLLPIIEELKQAGKVAADGTIDDHALLRATADHVYPDPLDRIWQAFNGLAQNPPDLIVTLHDGYFCGSESFANSVNVASTHGSLNYINSVTFIATTFKPLPEVIRMRQLPQVLPQILPAGLKAVPLAKSPSPGLK